MFGIAAMSSHLTAMAVIPGIVLLVYIYSMDKLEKEPTSLLISLLIWGVISTFIAILGEQIGGNILQSIFGSAASDGRDLIEYFLVVGLCEEWAKRFVLKRRTWNDPAFNCRFDAVVYAVAAAMGFAIFENIGYVAMYGSSTAIVRAFTAVPGHAAFGAFMGLYYGEAKEKAVSGDMKGAKSKLNAALIVPLLWHGAYDFLATRDSVLAYAFYPFIIFMFVTAIVKIRKCAKNDKYFDSGRDIMYYLFNNRM